MLARLGIYTTIVVERVIVVYGLFDREKNSRATENFGSKSRQTLDSGTELNQCITCFGNAPSAKSSGLVLWRYPSDR